jgi:hypothetical protein
MRANERPHGANLAWTDAKFGLLGVVMLALDARTDSGCVNAWVAGAALAHEDFRDSSQLRAECEPTEQRSHRPPTHKGSGVQRGADLPNDQMSSWDACGGSCASVCPADPAA